MATIVQSIAASAEACAVHVQNNNNTKAISMVTGTTTTGVERSNWVILQRQILFSNRVPIPIDAIVRILSGTLTNFTL